MSLYYPLTNEWYVSLFLNTNEKTATITPLSTSRLCTSV